MERFAMKKLLQWKEKKNRKPMILNNVINLKMNPRRQ